MARKQRGKSTPHPKRKRMRLYRRGHYVCVKFNDPIVSGDETVEQFSRRITQVVKEVAAPKVIVDLKRVRYISSAMLGLLLSAHRQLPDRGGKLMLTRPHPDIVEVLATTRLDRVFHFYQPTTPKARGADVGHPTAPGT